jgi:hypothetical protein
MIISHVIVFMDVSFVMSGDILCKMLVSGINEMAIAFPLKF